MKLDPAALKAARDIFEIELKINRLSPVDAFEAAMAEYAACLAGEGWRPTHRHKKRGSEYEVLGVGKMQASDDWRERGYDDVWQTYTDRGPVDMREVTVYRGEDGQLWVRPVDQFNDGRFEALPAPSVEENLP